MAIYGYGIVADRGFVAFEPELDDRAWKQIVTKKYEADGKDNAASLLSAPRPVVWKLRLRWSIGAILVALGAASLQALDQAWDAAQRRLYHRIAVGVDDEDRAVRDAADRLRSQLLSGSGTAQTQLDFDAEVDFGRQQIALTSEKGPLHGEAKKLKLTDVLAEVHKATEALASGVGRAAGVKRRAPSRVLRDAVATCAASFNSVHDEIVWFAERTPAGPERDNLNALLAPLDELLARHQPSAAPESVEEEGEAKKTPSPPAGPSAPA